MDSRNASPYAWLFRTVKKPGKPCNEDHALVRDWKQGGCLSESDSSDQENDPASCPDTVSNIQNLMTHCSSAWKALDM